MPVTVRLFVRTWSGWSSRGLTCGTAYTDENRNLGRGRTGRGLVHGARTLALGTADVGNGCMGGGREPGAMG